MQLIKLKDLLEHISSFVAVEVREVLQGGDINPVEVIDASYDDCDVRDWLVVDGRVFVWIDERR